MRRMVRWGSMSAMILGVGLLAGAVDESGDGRLKKVESVPRDELDAVVAASISADGRFLYAASWRPATITVFARDPKSGGLDLKQTIAEPALLAGTTAVTLSPDGRQAIASAFSSKTAVLFTRDADTGALTVLDAVHDGERGVRLGWPIDAAFSPDGKFVYVLDDNGSDAQQQGSVLTFRIDDGKLVLVGSDLGLNGCYAGARGLAFHPDGKTIFVACHRAGTLVVADRDPANGTTSVRQILKDGEGPVHSLAGAMGVTVSPDGRDVYVSAGRFGGDDAVTAFRLGSDGRLDLLQETVDGDGTLQGFKGGNHIAISPDGLDVYAAATRSRSVAAFRRDRATGLLQTVETLPDGGGEAGEAGAAAIAPSPDGRFVYVATEDGRSLTVFRRSPLPKP